ncbi:MAG: FAD-dependent oxidoreductase [Opitutaceae bacterium]|jgi:hypothetical protein|nr:FAD-dependent oxidoreductase [Opitutaceae bacterium]
MKTKNNSEVIIKRELSADFIVVGGGLAGVCAAIAAARHGASVLLIQDRPVLGGNASSEMRMGVMGAHGNNNKETGIFEELQLENIHKNPLMRYTLWDDILYSAIVREKITLLLNTSVRAVRTENNRIRAVTAWNSNEYCDYTASGRMFADCSGDGILRLSGTEFRTGREAASEFGEDFRLTPEADACTMGNSLLLQLRKCASHRPFAAPEWAHHFTDATIPKHCNVYPENNNFWWIEYGGNLDTIADAGAIQFELKRLAYGVWEYMKNHPDGRCANYELDWFGGIPGKRESCRFIGDLLLTQHDIMKGGFQFPDVIGHGGWTLDDHHPDGFYHAGPPSVHHYPPSPFGIPYRVLYSRNITNLFFAGRNISATHIGMSATRVMATCAVMGQAVGTAAALTRKYKCSPRDIYTDHTSELQDILQEDDQWLPTRPRKVSSLLLNADAQFDELRRGLDRSIEHGGWTQQTGDLATASGDTGHTGNAGTTRAWQGKVTENGVWLRQGESAGYAWTDSVTLATVRIVFDTDLSFQGKRMRKLEATPEYKELPQMLAREFVIEARIDGKWVEIVRECDNWRRLWRRTFSPVKCRSVRLRILAAWGGPDAPARVFSFECDGPGQ